MKDGTVVVTNVISTNQHDTQTFLMQIFLIPETVASSPSFSHSAVRATWRACSRAKIKIKVSAQVSTNQPLNNWAQENLYVDIWDGYKVCT